MKPTFEPSHYDTLHVAPDATADALRSAYRRAAQKHHPDRCGDDPAAQQRMARINEAYAVLSHPERRASYDRWVQARHARQRAEAAASAARPSRLAAAWPWGLIAATAAFTMLTIGTVLYKTSAAPQALAAKSGALASGR
ncbi:MAG TPA: J domain-containing protein [Ramlibacter sp.]|jgi:DnaJ-domain-containing protein 1|uniref:J domain-containing protein n=1 Tax=Ramlibacter sp. TaxID=1917967 RepID=UPI002D652159|nr:J domain-containing protein [Ramlibacter sp.]HZY19337.1 J domain-containing protein [Ramlibacter sp.]